MNQLSNVVATVSSVYIYQVIKAESVFEGSLPDVVASLVDQEWQTDYRQILEDGR